jgi:chromate transport protein ChrA
VRVAELVGGVFATVCVLLPSALLLVTLAPLFARLRDARFVRGAIRGLLAGFVAILLVVLYHVCQSAFVTTWAPLVSLACLAALRMRAPMGAVLLAAIAAAALLPA